MKVFFNKDGGDYIKGNSGELTGYVSNNSDEIFAMVVVLTSGEFVESEFKDIGTVKWESLTNKIIKVPIGDLVFAKW